VVVTWQTILGKRACLFRAQVDRRGKRDEGGWVRFVVAEGVDKEQTTMLCGALAKLEVQDVQLPSLDFQMFTFTSASFQSNS
jgi:hypothetical protein